MGRVIAIANLKGGIGKTTTVVNVGAGLALKGARVLLVDVDAQGNLSLALGVRPHRTIYDVLIDGVAPSNCIITTRPNLDLIAADHTLLSAQPIIGRRSDWSRVLEQTLRPVIPAYDFILIDSGGSLTLLNTNALVCASDVIVPTAVEPFSLKGIEMLFTHVTRIKGSSASIRMIIPTLYDPRLRQSSELLAQLQERYGALVAPPVRINVRLSEAPTLGQTIYEFDPRSRGAVDYALLVERLSTMFGFRPSTNTILPPHTATPTSDTTPPHTAAPTPNTTPPNTATPSTTPPSNDSTPIAPGCPNCGRPLQFATLAGYRVAYCDHCKYKTQTLAHGTRR